MKVYLLLLLFLHDGSVHSSAYAFDDIRECEAAMQKVPRNLNTALVGGFAAACSTQRMLGKEV
jgi:hypothetical protein